MAFLLVERSNGGKLIGDYDTREEAEAERDRLTAEDPRYADVLVILRDGRDEPSDPRTDG